jgi:hypothetical protein
MGRDPVGQVPFGLGRNAEKALGVSRIQLSAKRSFTAVHSVVEAEKK